MTGPALACPGCGSPDVDLRRGLLCEMCAETTPPGQPEARAACEHFYASHCYRGMDIRLCMTCGEPDWDDLERQLREAAGDIPVAGPLIMPADESWTPEEIADLKARFEAAMANPGPLRVLPSDRWKDRAEAAEAKLAEVREHCQKKANWFDGMVAANRILAITGTEEEAHDA